MTPATTRGQEGLDEALAGTGPAPESAVTVISSDRRCRRHQWEPTDRQTYSPEGAPRTLWACVRCEVVRDETRSRRGKSARRRGVDYERDVASVLGGSKVGHHGGPVDVQTPLLNVQVKVRGAFPSWMTDELDKLPRTGGRVPALVVADTPGAGRRRRAVVVMSLEDFRDLHGAR